jgi:hypothetical protein
MRLVDSYTINSILKKIKYLKTLTRMTENILTRTRYKSLTLKEVLYSSSYRYLLVSNNRARWLAPLPSHALQLQFFLGARVF